MATTPVPLPQNRYLACTGDSLTNNHTLGNLDSEFWPTVLEKWLNETGNINDGLAPQAGPKCNMRSRNFGLNGATSGPHAQATATCNTVGSTTSYTLTSVTGTIFVGQTVIIGGHLGLVASWNSGTGVMGLTYPISGLSSGNNYPVYGLSSFGTDVITRLNFMLGSSTPKALDLLFQYDKPAWDPPDMAAIWIGVNDPGAATQAIVGFNLNTTIKTAPSNSGATWPYVSATLGLSPQTTLIPLQTGQGSNVTVGQCVVIVDWTQTPAQPWIGLVVAVSGDTIYVSQNTHAINQGLSPWFEYFQGGENPLASQPPVGASVYQGTEANIIGAVIALQYYAGTSKFLVGNSQYLNYSSGGDTLATPYATYATLRGFQSAAVTLLTGQGVAAALVDIYTYMRSRINNGDYFTFRSTIYKGVQGDYAWHFANSNQHLNPLGNAIVAMAFLGAIQGQTGWTAALT